MNHYEEQRLKQQLIDERKTKVTAAFKDIRKLGIVARQNFWCCRTCAGADLDEKCTALLKKKKPFRGAVYFTQQDNDDRESGARLYIAFAGNTTFEKPSPPEGDLMGTTAVGHVIKSVFEKHGLVVEWNGSPDQRIAIAAVA